MKKAALALAIAWLIGVTGCGLARPAGQNRAGARSVDVSGGSSPAPWTERSPLPEENGAPPLSPSSGGEIIEIGEKLFIAQTNEVYINAEDYLGKTIRYQGIFKSLYLDEYDAGYCSVIRYGPGCCGDGAAGFEVAWEDAPFGDPRYPQDNAWVEATGVLKSYMEGGYSYLYLALSSLTEKAERGTEFVSH